MFGRARVLLPCISPVFGGGPAHGLRHRDRPPHEGNGVEDEDPRDVEKEMAERDLETVLKVVTVRRKGS